MPVTFIISSHLANRFSNPDYRGPPSNDPHTILTSLPTTHTPARLLQSSVDGTQDILVRKNGFVLGAVLAYNEHHNLVIRPDDVWIAILSQLNWYINAHAEELRDKFVAHEGKKDLEVVTAAPLDSADFGDMAVQMASQIHENVKDKSLVPWVLPDFSTTTPNDTIICSAIIMATLKQYFNYIMKGKCGIPSITLEGTQSDWQSILDRIEKIPEFGAQPKEWAGMLRVILRRFARAFDEGGPQADMEFWERMINQEAQASRSYYISGWMSAFCAWNHKGGFFPSRHRQGKERDENPSWVHGLSFDGVWFPRVVVPPEGYAEVDVMVHDMSTMKVYDCTILAGHVGVYLGDEAHLDTVHMAPQWFMYVKGEERQLAGRYSITGFYR